MLELVFCISTENLNYSSFFMACYREFQDQSQLNYAEDRRFRLNFALKMLSLYNEKTPTMKQPLKLIRIKEEFGRKKKKRLNLND